MQNYSENCKKEIFDDYFEWMFTILEKFRKQPDFSKYEYVNAQVLGHLSERLERVMDKKTNSEKNMILRFLTLRN